MVNALRYIYLVREHPTQYIYELNIIGLTISTGRRQTTWLFKILNEELNYGLLAEKQLQLNGQSGT